MKICEKSMENKIVDANNLSDKALRHFEICEQLNDIYRKKNHDYGDSFGKFIKIVE